MGKRLDFWGRRGAGLLGALSLVAAFAVPNAIVEDVPVVHGMTISTSTSGSEWGTPGFAAELDRLQAMRVNWVAIHPYAGIGKDGLVRYREWEGETGPSYLAESIAAAHARGMQILIKPHLAYWGSGFGWRGEIEFEGAEANARFWESFREWTVDLAAASKAADGFSVGCELSLLEGEEAQWRALIHDVRAVTKAQLIYSANWDCYRKIKFWDALDAIGVQAYFPLEVATDDALPSEADLHAAWLPHLAELKSLSDQTGKPIVFAELGYDRNELAHLRPWEGAHRRTVPSTQATELQRRCLKVAMEVMDRERVWLRGAFLWKWFVGRKNGSDFNLDHDLSRGLIRSMWRPVAALGMSPAPAPAGG
jgi:hypothetical protein